MEMSDTSLFFSESTHSLVEEAVTAIRKQNDVANQNEICSEGAWWEDFNSDRVGRINLYSIWRTFLGG